MHGEKSLTDYLGTTVLAHNAYLNDSAAHSQLHLFDSAEQFMRVFAYGHRLKASCKVPFKVKVDTDLRIDLEIQRDSL